MRVWCQLELSPKHSAVCHCHAMFPTAVTFSVAWRNGCEDRRDHLHVP